MCRSGWQRDSSSIDAFAIADRLTRWPERREVDVRQLEQCIDKIRHPGRGCEDPPHVLAPSLVEPIAQFFEQHAGERADGT